MAATSFVQLTQEAERSLEMSMTQSKPYCRTLGRARSMREIKEIGIATDLHPFSTGSLDVEPRKTQSFGLSEIRWDALSNRRERRRVLSLRGFPSKLCTAEALNALLLAEGLGDTVEDLKVFPGKAGRLGCAIVRARGVADVERLAKTFHGRQFGCGSPIAVSFVAPGGLHGSAQFGAPPIKVPSLGAMPVKIQSTLSTAKLPTSPSTSPSLVPGSITLIQSVPDLALSADLGVLKESRAASNGIHRVDTASSLASSLATERQSLQSISCGNSPRGSLFSSSADSNCDEDCILEASYLRPPPGLEGLQRQ